MGVFNITEVGLCKTCLWGIHTCTDHFDHQKWGPKHVNIFGKHVNQVRLLLFYHGLYHIFHMCQGQNIVYDAFSVYGMWCGHPTILVADGLIIPSTMRGWPQVLWHITIMMFIHMSYNNMCPKIDFHCIPIKTMVKSLLKGPISQSSQSSQPSHCVGIPKGGLSTWYPT